MEIYEHNDRQQKDQRPDPYARTKESIFAYRRFNETLPLWEKILFFIIGFIGLQLVAIAWEAILQKTSAVNDTVYYVGLVNFLSYLVIVIALVLLLLFDKKKTLITFFKSFKDVSVLKIGALGYCGLLMVNAIFNLLYMAIPYYGVNTNQSTLELIASSYPVIIIFMTVIFAPFVEEFTYRVGLGDTLGHKKPILGIILSALIFGLIHFDFTAISDVITATSESTYETALIYLYNELLNLPIYISSGAVLCLTYFYSGKLSSSFTAHFLNNGISVFVMLLVY